MNLESAAESARSAILSASAGLVGRESLVELVVLCAVAGEHLLVIGPPGTAKSEAVRRIARRLGGQYFEYLLGRFTEPSELFGPVNLKKLKEGLVETETAGMLPEAHVAFLDEVFLGSTAILNTLLAILNERTFRRGHTQMACPLRVAVGAANRLPEDEQLAAFADRFLVRAFVEPIGDSGLESLLASGWNHGPIASVDGASMTAIDALAHAAREMDMRALQGPMAQAVRTLRGIGIELTDRRIVRTQKLIAASAALAGRTQPDARDLWPLICVLPTAAAQEAGREALRELLQATENRALVSAALESSFGAKARGARILRDAANIFAEAPSPGLRLRLEGIAREIDATFARDALPADLGAFRQRIIESLGSTEAPVGAGTTRSPGSA